MAGPLLEDIFRNMHTRVGVLETQYHVALVPNSNPGDKGKGSYKAVQVMNDDMYQCAFYPLVSFSDIIYINN